MSLNIVASSTNNISESGRAVSSLQAQLVSTSQVSKCESLIKVFEEGEGWIIVPLYFYQLRCLACVLFIQPVQTSVWSESVLLRPVWDRGTGPLDQGKIFLVSNSTSPGPGEDISSK